MTGASSAVRVEALILTALTLAVVAVSAWLRLHGVGLGCADWPACYGRDFAVPTYAPPAAGRLLHRLVATAALLLTIHLAWRAWRSRPSPVWAKPVFALLGLMVLLSVVGIWSHDPRNTAGNLINLVGGLLLVPLSWRVAILSRSPDQGLPARRSVFATVAAMALVAAVLLGAWIGASHAAIDTSPGGQALHWLHRGLAVLAVILLGAFAWSRYRPGLAGAVLLLPAAEVGLGGQLVLGDFPLWAAVAHNVVAALILTAAWRIAETPERST